MPKKKRKELEVKVNPDLKPLHDAEEEILKRIIFLLEMGGELSKLCS